MAQLEAVLSRGFDAVVADLATRAATAPVANAEQRWSKPEITGRLDTLRMLLRRADGCTQPASMPACDTEPPWPSSQSASACSETRQLRQPVVSCFRVCIRVARMQWVSVSPDCLTVGPECGLPVRWLWSRGLMLAWS